MIIYTEVITERVLAQADLRNLELAIVHGIVSDTGGFITCESEPGHGTVFQVYFPVYEDEAVVRPTGPESSPTGGEQVLFVDDEPLLAEMGKAMLERLGYTVISSTNSLEALAIFKHRPNEFDAVITDQTMPAMTGMDLAQRMLRIRPDIPIILCTGYSNLTNEQQVRISGIKGFLMKPLSKKVLPDHLRRVLDETGV